MLADDAIRRNDCNAAVQQGSDIQIAEHIDRHGVETLVMASGRGCDQLSPLRRWPGMAAYAARALYIESPYASPFGFRIVERCAIRRQGHPVGRHDGVGDRFGRGPDFRSIKDASPIQVMRSRLPEVGKVKASMLVEDDIVRPFKPF